MSEKIMFSEFPPISTDEWEEKIRNDLKGADYKRLIWNTNEGFDVRPYYRAEDIENINFLNTLPGNFPYVRGNSSNNNNWLIRQNIKTDNPETANKEALLLIEKGVDSIGFIIEDDKNLSSEDIDILLKNLPLNKIEVNFIVEKNALSIAQSINECKNNKSISGSLTFDPIICIAKNTNVYFDSSIDIAYKVIKQLSDIKYFKSLTIQGDIFENAGASIIQQLALSMSIANEYLSSLSEKDLSFDDIASSIKFQFAIGSNYFMEIAKIRAARILWSAIVNEYAPKDKDCTYATIHCISSDWNKTIYAPYVNLLRTQTEAMSAVLGGTDSLCIKAFNNTYSNDDFGKRIARNQQLLLKHEAHFDKVKDPGAGSYYIETLTNSLAIHSWDLFVEIEKKGGFTKAYKQGYIPNIIKETANKKDLDIAQRKTVLLGVNKYPDINEVKSEEFNNLFFDKKNNNTSLKKYRGASAIERLRYKTDKYSQNNPRPIVFMLTIGDTTMRKVRAQFACDFFATAGFKVINNNGFNTIAEGIESAKKEHTSIIVLCSSDEEYSTYAPETIKLSKDKIVVVAGYPKTIINKLIGAGVKHFIHAKSNLITELSKFQDLLIHK